MLILGDCINVLKSYPDNTFDLIVTDPPYGLAFMGKDWDKALVSKETWAECYRVLKEGKLAFVMCSPRQDVLSRMIINLEDAGFRTNYSSIYWTYSSGFPKAANISKLIDKKAGVEREIIGKRTDDRYGRNYTNNSFKNGIYESGHDVNNVGLITKPATPEAKKMEGSYVGFQPKPAVEVILVVSKGKTLTWLDDCRIPYQSEDDKESAKPGSLVPLTYRNYCERHGYDRIVKEPGLPNPVNEKGRFPANLLVSDDVLNDGKIHKTSLLDSVQKFTNPPIKDYERYQKSMIGKRIYHPADEGSYSRYFSLDSWAEKTLPFLIVPKASKSERNKGCEDLPFKEIPHSTNMVCATCGKRLLDRKNTCECEVKQEIRQTAQNHHPTVKPLKLMSYLITMGSREGDLILDPFCGSGTTCIAAEKLHRKCIGIEINPEYLEIAKARLKPVLDQKRL